MTGAWIGNRWWQDCATRSPEYNRLTRKRVLLLARADSSRSAALVRRYCAYIGAAEIVARRIDALSDVRMAA